MKRVLYFYPHKFAALTDGSHVRAVSLLQFFSSRGILVDMVSFDNPAIAGNFVTENKLVHQLHLVSGNPFLQTPPTKKTSFFNQLAGIVSKKKPNEDPAPPFMHLPDFMTAALTQQASELDRKEIYDAVVVSYTYWAGFIKAIKKNKDARKILDTHDFLTLQQFYSRPQHSYANVGSQLGEELDRMAGYEDVMHISLDELLFFSNFIPTAKHHFIPQFFSAKQKLLPERNIKYDVLFIGSGNPYNIEGVNWFIQEVYPLLKKNIQIAIAGNVCNTISFEADNIIKLGFIDDIDNLYMQSRCTICPLKKGSGMKIKVVESIAYGIPVISTSKGIDGFANKDPEGGILVRDTAVDFAAAISRVIDEPDYYLKQSALARQLFEKYFSSEANFLKLDTIFS